jgi:hypothetical protein
VEERSDNELDSSQASTVKNQLRNSAIDGIAAVILYVVSLTNQELQAYYEHLRTVRDIIIKEQQQNLVQAKLDSFFKPEL